ncbi:MAG: hypothetical protein IJD85_02890 [Oscillospiraceae bacterium]|nr:hypothetical protein [Oscillospiraceae bacterium]
MNRVILAGFDGENNPARIVTERAECGCRKVILPNDKERSVKALFVEIDRAETSVVIMLGQKPRIRNKISVEPTARCGCETLHTPMDVTTSAELIKQSGYGAYISSCGCGTSYCNHIYFECLKRGVCCIFLHVPTMNNISDINKLITAVEGYIGGIAGIPCML